MCRQLFRGWTGLALAGLLWVWPSAAAAEGREVTQVITSNPFLLTGGWLNLEYERRVGRATTWGASLSRYAPSVGGYRGAKAVLRYYPSGRALDGGWVGVRTGRSRLWGIDDWTAYSLVGAEMGYSSVFGRDQRVVLSLGVGASRLLDGPTSFPKVLPSLRANIGLAW